MRTAGKSIDVLDPTLDVVFKMLFADEKNKPLLISLLTAVLLPESPIQDVHILNPEIPKDFAMEKGVILDIFLKLQNESQINVEMQSTNFHNIVPRTLFYWAKTFTQQLSSGNSQVYTLLKPTSCIMFLDFIQFQETPNQLHSSFELKETNSGLPLSPLLKLHFIELPKLKKHAPKLDSKNPDITLWAKFLTFKNEEDLEKLAMTHPIIKQAKDALVEISSKKANRIAAESRKKALLDYKSGLYDAKAEGKEEGKAEGLAEGMQIGLGKGEQVGIAKGKHEALLSVAKNLLNQGQSVEQIQLATGLSDQDIKKLLN